MINYIQIENFKSLKILSMPVTRLNLLFGMNGMGKSSVLQSLLLLRQSMWKSGGRNIDALYTNGDLLKLGTCKDIFCQTADKEEVRICVKYSDFPVIDYVFKYDDETSLTDKMKSISYGIEAVNYSLFSEEFRYLGADHLGPQNQYGLENWNNSSINPLGKRGEYVVPFLAKNGDSIHVPDSMCLDNGKTDRLIDQVSAWMSVISPGIRLSAELNPIIQKAQLSIGYDGARLTTDSFSPINVGFGIPYVLPLIVILLISNGDNLIIIENPESHLHPRGQSMMARLISLAAVNGAQIFCESHSDHIINGIRVAVKNKLIKASDIQINYFSKNNNQESVTTPINIDSNGNLSEYPEGLLDEWGTLMAELI